MSDTNIAREIAITFEQAKETLDLLRANGREMVDEDDLSLVANEMFALLSKLEKAGVIRR